MANIKFSQFVPNGTIDGGLVPAPSGSETSFLVGFDSTTPTNNYWTFEQVKAGLAAAPGTAFSIYAADGTIGTTRKALITDTIQFRNAGDTSDVFTLNTDGTFALGLGASTTGATQVAIGSSATVAAAHGIAVGSSSNAGSNGISIGQSSLSAIGGIAIGYDSGSSTNNCINIGSTSAGTGANSITLNATGLSAAPSTASAFGVYMSSNTTPDLEVVGGGESTLNTSLKITGQGYTEQHDQTDLTISWNNSNVVYATLTTGTILFDPSDAKSGATYILYLRQPASGGPTLINWNSLVLWPGGTPPTLSTTAGATDVITLIYNGTGAKYYGTSVLNFS